MVFIMKRKKRRSHKKAQIREFVVFIVSIVLIAVTLLIAKVVYEKIGEGLNDADFATVESTKAYQDFQVSFEIFDIAMIFIILALTIGLVITSFFIPTHPVFMVINIVGMIFLAFMAAILSNVYGEMIDLEEIQEGLNYTDIHGDTKLSFTRTSFIMSVLPWICLAVIALITILMYAKGSL